MSLEHMFLLCIPVSVLVAALIEWWYQREMRKLGIETDWPG